MNKHLATAIGAAAALALVATAALADPGSTPGGPGAGMGMGMQHQGMHGMHAMQGMQGVQGMQGEVAGMEHGGGHGMAGAHAQHMAMHARMHGGTEAAADDKPAATPEQRRPGMGHGAPGAAGSHRH